MELSEHQDLEAWVIRYGSTAILGFICFLLIAGKFIHEAASCRGLVFGGLIGRIFCVQILWYKNKNYDVIFWFD